MSRHRLGRVRIGAAGRMPTHALRLWWQAGGAEAAGRHSVVRGAA